MAGINGSQSPYAFMAQASPAEGLFDANGHEAPLPDFLRPSDSYIPASFEFILLSSAVPIEQLPTTMEFLPEEAHGDRLMLRYFEAVHPVARCVHRPSFELLYCSFRNDVREYFEPRVPVQAAVFAAWFSAAISLDEGDAQREYGMSKGDLVNKFRIGTEIALARARCGKTTRLETLQAFVMYLVSWIRPT